MTQSKKQAHRFISLSGLRKVAGPPESSFEVIVVDQRGRPVSHLTEWYRQRRGPGPDRTRQTYLGMLLRVMGFFLEQGCAWNDSPERVRIHLVEFLRERMACQVQPDQDREGYWVETSGTSPLSKSGLGVLLAAMNDFYRLMTEAGYYPYPNPLNSQLLEQWRRERARLIAHAGAPDQAGIRSESWMEGRQHPVAYFRQGSRKAWKPKIVLESQETREQLQDALLFMTNYAPTQRDKVILLLLRHTGARLHEILGMTAGGCRKALDPLNAYVVNKGSLGLKGDRSSCHEIEHLLHWAYSLLPPPMPQAGQASPTGKSWQLPVAVPPSPCILPALPLLAWETGSLPSSQSPCSSGIASCAYGTVMLLLSCRSTKQPCAASSLTRSW